MSLRIRQNWKLPEKVFKRRKRGSIPASETDYRVYELSLSERVRYGICGAAVAAVIAFIFYRSVWMLILAVPLAAFYPEYRKKDLKNARDRKLAAEFREGITVLSSALGAGYSLENALEESESELRLLYGDGSMIVREFSGINHRRSMNIPVEIAWEEFGERSGSEDIRNFARVIRIAKRSGGELASIISRSADVIGDKIRIREEILTVTAAKRFEQSIMNLVPVFIVIYIEATSPGFFDTLYTTFFGRVIMTGCLAVYTGAVFLAKRILDIEI